MKEKFKSFVLVVLVVLNLILGSQVLSTEKLWSGDGYNFFVSRTNNPITSFLRKIKTNIKGKSPSKTQLEAPELIIINTGDQTSRNVITNADSGFYDIIETTNEFLRSAFSSSKQYTQVSTDDFYSALTSKSVLLSYSTEYDSGLFAHLLGATKTDYSGIFHQLKNIVISSDGYVYVEDSLTDIIYCCYTDIQTTALNDIIDIYASQEKSDNLVINYAFDLGFDKSFATQKTVLSPMIPIYSDSFEVEAVSVNGTIVNNGIFDESVIPELLPIFNMNPNSFRRYTEVDGTLVFVENNATLKISPKGFLEYNAKDNGISLSTTNTSSYDTVATVADFVDKINIAVGSDNSMVLTSKLTEAELSQSNFNITLDYLANGRRVIIKPDNIEPAVTAVVTNNRLTHYKQYMRRYTVTSERSLVDNYIFALDDSIAKFQNQINDIEISDLDIAYEDDFNNETIHPQWNVAVKEIIIS